jgi:hypothetical protein
VLKLSSSEVTVGELELLLPFPGLMKEAGEDGR